MFTLRHRALSLSLLVVLSLVGACGGTPDTPGSNGELPTLTLHHVSATLETSPTSLMTRVVIGSNGDVAMPSDQESDHLILVVDSTGAMRAQLGTRGSGPGEMRMAHLVAVDDQTVTAFDQMQSRLVVIGHDDSLRSQVTFNEPIMPLHLSKEGLLGVGMGTGGWRVAMASAVTGVVTDAVAPTDSFLTANFPRPNMAGTEEMMTMTVPSVGMWGDQVVLANGHEYRLMVYGREGAADRMLSRTLPPAVLSQARVDAEMRMAKAMMARMGVADVDGQLEKAMEMRKAMKIPHFGMNGLMTDHAGRAWIVGAVGDSAFADVFVESGFVGRIGIPCLAFSDVWHLNGSWLAMVCAPDDPEDDRDAVIKVFRIG